jgi:hypothetical protein
LISISHLDDDISLVPALAPDKENPMVVFLDEGEDKTAEFYYAMEPGNFS